MGKSTLVSLCVLYLNWIHDPLAFHICTQNSHAVSGSLIVADGGQRLKKGEAQAEAFRRDVHSALICFACFTSVAWGLSGAKPCRNYYIEPCSRSYWVNRKLWPLTHRLLWWWLYIDYKSISMMYDSTVSHLNNLLYNSSFDFIWG